MSLRTNSCLSSRLLWSVSTPLAVTLVGFGFTTYAHSDATDPAHDTNSDQSFRIPPQELPEALQGFRTHVDFRVTLAAAEPLIRDPVAIAFDTRGRMFVVEAPEYNQYATEQKTKHRGAVKLLEDTNGDGRFDRATVFAKNLNYPTAIACYGGGVFIGAAPDILFCIDEDGDGQADNTDVIFTGFGTDPAGERHINSMRWGLDNRFYLSTSGGGGDVRVAGEEESSAVSVRGRCFVFDPRDLTRFELTSGGGQHGMCFDDWGRRYICSNGVPMELHMFDDRYLERNPYVAVSSTAVGIAPHGKHTQLFRISPPEPWRVARTKLRAASAKGDYEGGAPFGFFTAATGVTVYRGDAWPSEYRGDILVGEPANNLIYRARPQPSGLSLTTHRTDAGQEFLASSDIWFRPVQFAHGPDGTLLVIDMYREMIEGAEFLPAEILQHLDAGSGVDRGRIYRIAPTNFSQRQIPPLALQSSLELVAFLEHPNAWHRDTAARLLYQRQDRSVVAALETLAQGSSLPQGRLQALYTLDGLGALTADILLAQFDDPHAHVRRHAVRLAEQFVNASPLIVTRLNNMVDDPESIVRYQLAFSLGALPVPTKARALTALARQSAGDSWMELAIHSSLHDGLGAVLENLATDANYAVTDVGLQFLESLAGQIGKQQKADDLAVVFRLIRSMSSAEKNLITTIVKGLAPLDGSPLATQLSAATAGRVAEVTREILAQAIVVSQDLEQPINQRVAGIQLLSLGAIKRLQDVFESLLAPEQPPAIQAAAIETLSTWHEETAPRLLIDRWQILSPTLRSQANEVLFSQPNWIPLILDALESQTIAVSDLEPARWQQLAGHPDKALRTRAASLQQTSSQRDRNEVLEEYRTALRLKPDQARGKILFQKHCTACHRLDGEGHDIGPSLLTVRNRSTETILYHVIAPNREVDPRYLNYLVYTHDGRTLTGMIATETATSITLKRAGNDSLTVLRKDIDELQSTGLSLMPEGLEKELGHQAMADLIGYVSLAEDIAQ